MDNEFFVNGGIPSHLQYDQQFTSTMPTWQSIANSIEFQNNQSQDYLLSTPPPTDHYESALSSMVSSPVASNSALSSDNFMIRELIGKLGNICNSNDLPNYTNPNIGNCSTNNSCYTTPLSSPPKMGLQMPNLDHFVNENFPILGNSIGLASNLPAMPGDPGFAERAARFSSFGSRSFNGRTSTNQFNKKGDLVQRSCSNLGGVDCKIQRVSSSPLLKEPLPGSQSNERNKQSRNSSISGQNQTPENGLNRKRKASISKGKGKEITNSNKVAEKGDDSKAKRSKSEESNGKVEEKEEEEDNKKGDDNQKAPEPFKDYIHVRARRGQATDSHSLAERVRREKISERMKLLQDLVPGCNRVTGKALMLDEIINYVQSLQRQVEFLSMKLSTVNPSLEVNMNNLITKDGNQPNCRMRHPMYPTMVPNQYGQPHQNPLRDCIPTIGVTVPCPLDPLIPTLNHNHHSSSHLSSTHPFSNSLPKPSLCEGDLQSIVQMGYLQTDDGFQTQPSQGPNPTQMKIEL